MTDKTPALPPSDSEALIAALLTDLFYPSESDEPLLLLRCPLDQPERLTTDQIRAWLLLPPEVSVEETQEDTFWQPVITEETWYDAEEIKRTTAFRQLQSLLAEHLSQRQVFRVGDTEVAVYLLGRTTAGPRLGLQTTVVET